MIFNGFRAQQTSPKAIFFFHNIVASIFGRWGLVGGDHEGVEALAKIFDFEAGLVQKIPKRQTEMKVDWLNLTARASLRSLPKELEVREKKEKIITQQ